MSDAPKILNQVDALSNIILLSLFLMQQITGKTKEETMKMIDQEGIKTDALLMKLK